ncbi:MAG: beta-ketoacyl synthase N-terminal-like domain-containing protein [Terracidiphilus sp.]
MNTTSTQITGIGSVTPYGPLAGLLNFESSESSESLEPRVITAWTTPGLRRAFLVEPFRPAAVVPGLKTRRLDRLSAWALVASSLALQDAGVDLNQMDRSRIAVVFATSFGCVELTEAFYQSAAANGWPATDPITFPETLSNAPAAHVALFHQLQGPNLTISSKSFAAESALLQAASLLRHNQADLAVVIAGDTLTQPVYEWYEAAHLLAPACFNEEPLAPSTGFIPGEGVVATVLEPTGKRQARSYAALRGGHWASGGDAQSCIHQLLGGAAPLRTICAGNGAPCASSELTCSARRVVGPEATILPQQPVAAGLADAGALFHLLLALSRKSGSGEAIMLGTAGVSGFAALHLELL